MPHRVRMEVEVDVSSDDNDDDHDNDDDDNNNNTTMNTTMNSTSSMDLDLDLHNTTLETSMALLNVDPQTNTNTNTNTNIRSHDDGSIINVGNAFDPDETMLSMQMNVNDNSNNNRDCENAKGRERHEHKDEHEHTTSRNISIDDDNDSPSPRRSRRPLSSHQRSSSSTQHSHSSSLSPGRSSQRQRQGRNNNETRTQTQVRTKHSHSHSQESQSSSQQKSQKSKKSQHIHSQQHSTRDDRTNLNKHGKERHKHKHTGLLGPGQLPDLGPLLGQGPHETSYKEHYESKVYNIITHQSHMEILQKEPPFELPSSSHHDNINERIAHLYTQLKIRGVHDLLKKIHGMDNNNGMDNHDGYGVDRHEEKEQTLGDEDSYDFQDRYQDRYQDQDSSHRAQTQAQTQVQAQTQAQTQAQIQPQPQQQQQQQQQFESQSTIGASNLSKDHSFNMSNAVVVGDDLLHNHKNSEVNVSNHDNNDNGADDGTDDDAADADSTVSSVELARSNGDMLSGRSGNGNGIGIGIGDSGHGHGHGRPSVCSGSSSSFHSPYFTTGGGKKRFASMSGKKGLDLQRMRHDHDVHHDCLDNGNDGSSDFMHKFNMQEEDEGESPPMDIDMDVDMEYQEFSQQVNDMMNSPVISSGGGRKSSFLNGTLLQSQSPIIIRRDDDMDMGLGRDEGRKEHSESRRRRKYSFDSNSSSSTSSCNSNGNVSLGGDGGDGGDGEVSFHIHHDEGDDDDNDNQDNEFERHGNDSIHSASSPINDSIESVDSTQVRMKGRRRHGKNNHNKEQSKRNKNRDSIIDDVDDDDDDDDEEFGGRGRLDVSLRDDSRLYYDPLKVYRPPKWTKRYHERRKEKKKKKTKKKDKHRYYTGGKENESPNLSPLEDDPQPIPTLTLLQDPFHEFGTRTSERLEVVADWLNGKDSGAHLDLSNHNHNDNPSQKEQDTILTKGKAVILSLSARHIISIVIQLLYRNNVHQIPRGSRHIDNSRRRRRRSSKETNVEDHGGTLIVVRSKEELGMWENAFREMTNFTVLSHATIPSTERRRVTMPSKAAGFDVVLTTYDAVKTKEMNTTVDSSGRATTQDETTSQGGWMSIRMSGDDESQQGGGTSSVQVLSRLHGISWYRLILMDELGRSSYLTKPGTTRLQATAALKGDKRMIFFARTPQSDETYFFEDKLKDSRRQLIPLARALDLPENRTGDTVVGESMLDYRDVRDEQDVVVPMEEEESSSVDSSRFSDSSVTDDGDSSRFS